MKYVESEEEAKAFVEEISEKYKDARHNVYAYVVNGQEKAYDDGEPKGTAGLPIRSLIHQKRLNNIVIVVSRYFGGIKLGASGLIRAYRRGVIEALNEIEIKEK
jgi:uncharacterized YigZ family protein